MIVFYTAGPYRALGAWRTELNIRIAENAAQMLRRHGQYVICPHTNCRYSDYDVRDEQYLAETMELMRRCDVVLVLPGWQDSAGTIGEINEAERRQMPLLYLEAYGERPDWIAVINAARDAIQAAA